MTGARAAAESDPNGSWPVRLAWQEVRDLLARHDVPVAPQSPVRPVVEKLRPSVATRPDREPRVDALVARALAVVGRAGQLIAVRRGEGRRRSLFLNDGRSCVQWAISDGGVTLGRPLTHAQFAADAARGVMLTQTASGDDHRAVSRALLARLAVARRCGLTRPPQLTLQAVELVREESPPQPARTITVFGSRDARLVYDPGSCPPAQGDMLLALVPVTGEALIATIGLLLAAPPSPPTAPVTDHGAGDLRHWLSGDPAEELPRWRDDTYGELALAGASDARAARAMFSPAATIDVQAWSRARGESARKTLALTADVAVEWAMRGARVRWRALDVPAASRWLLELAAIVDGRDGGVRGCPPIGLQRRTVASLTAAHREPLDGVSREATAPAELAEPETTWVLIRVRVGGGSRRRVTELLVGVGRGPARWWFTGDARGCAARQGDPGALAREIVSSLCGA